MNDCMHKLELMQSLCRLEWEQVSRRVTHLLLNDLSEQIISGENKYTKKKKINLGEYDRLMTRISNVTNILRRLNIYLSCVDVDMNMELSPNIDQQLFDDNNNNDENIKSLMKPFLMESIESSDVQNPKNTKNIQNIQNKRRSFEKDQKFLAYITYIESYDNLVFYACHHADYETILTIGDLNLNPIVNFDNVSLMNNIIFGVSYTGKSLITNNIFNREQSKFIWRGQFLDELCNNSSLDNRKVLLIDTGEVIKVDNSTKFYILPMSYRQLSPMAFCCTLKGVLLNEMDNLESCLKASPKFLCSQQNHEVQLYVISISNDKESRNDIKDITMLHVYMYANNSNDENIKNTIENFDKNVNQITDNNENFINNIENNKYDLLINLNNDQNDTNFVLNFSKNNHESKNNNYIENEKTVFNESNRCQNDNNTLTEMKVDIKKEFQIFNNDIEGSYEVGCIYSVTITHIENMWDFYGYNIDQEVHPDLSKFSWDMEELTDLLNSPNPKENFAVGDIVLALYMKDAFWYRGFITQVFPDRDCYKVLYIDFGNSAELKSDQLLSCFPNCKQVPPQVNRFCLDDFEGSNEDHINVGTTIGYKKMLQVFLITYLNQTINLQIVEHAQDSITVRIIDDNYENISKSLLKATDSD